MGLLEDEAAAGICIGAVRRLSAVGGGRARARAAGGQERPHAAAAGWFTPLGRRGWVAGKP